MYSLRRLAAAIIVLGLQAVIACAPGPPPVGQAGPAIQDGRAAQVGPPAVPGVDGPPGTTALDTPTLPWAGPDAVTRSTAAIMAEADRSPQVADPEPRRFVKVRPDRRDLPGHPDARPLPSWPPRPLFDRAPAGPSVAQTLATPNVTVASLGEDSNALPPDTMGDVGPTQYLVGVNGRIRTIAKASGLADGVLNASFDTFFAGIRDGAGTSDPRVRFDRRNDRWIVIMLSVALPNRNLVAVSDTATITASTVWSYFQWTNTRTQGGVGGGALCLGDYPSLGVDEDALYIGVNQFCGADITNLSFDSTSIYVVHKSALLSGSLAVTQFDGVAVNGGAGPYTPQGVDNFDSGTNQGYIIGVDNLVFGQLTLRRVSNPAGAPSLSANIAIAVPTTTPPMAVPHPGGAVPLDAIDDRLLQAVVRNGRLWTTHHIEVNGSGVAQAGGGRNGVRWYELRDLAASPSLVQSGTVFDPSGATPASFWFGAIMPSGQGHVALGMTIAGAATRVNATVTGRLASDPLGTMNGAPVVYSPNTSFSYNVQGSPATRQRWGDYSYTSVDPDDDMTLWTIQEYVDANDSYGVRLVRLLAPPPATLVSVAPSTLLPSQAGATLTVTAASSNGSGFFDPGAGFVRRLTADFSGAGVTVTNVAVTSPTTLTLTVSTSNATTGPRTLTITNPDGQTRQLASAVTIGSDVNPPGPPRTLVATTARHSVVFGWQPPATSDPVLGYILEAGPAPGTTTITVPLGQVLAFAATAADGVYFVRVRATTAAGSGPPSNEVQIALGQVAPPLAPQALLATVQETAVTLQWTENPFGPVITAYQVHAGSASGVSNIGVIALAASARTFSVPAPPGTYFVRLVAVNAAGASAPSNEAVVVTGAGICTVPAAPTGLQTSAAPGVINVWWNAASAGAIPLGYVVRAGSVSGAADRGTFSFPARVTAVGGPVPSGPYFIQAAATNACGMSAASVEVSRVVP